jgi:hypothetical protein
MRYLFGRFGFFYFKSFSQISWIFSLLFLFSIHMVGSLVAGDHRRGQVQACFRGDRAGSARHRQGCRHGLQGHRLRVQVADIPHDYDIYERKLILNSSATNGMEGYNAAVFRKLNVLARVRIRGFVPIINDSAPCLK